MQRTAAIVSTLWFAACVGQPDPGAGRAADSSITETTIDGSAPSTTDARPGQPDAPPASQADARPGDLPGNGVQWLTYPAQQALSDPSWGDALTDIARHLPAQYGSTYYDSDKVTHAHETSHGIHAHLRNYENNTGQRANAFYVLGDRAALVVEPNIRKAQIAQYVPQSLRGSRFSTYITGQTAWDDTPLYVWDEWNAYINGGAVGVDLVAAGMWSYGWRDAVMGQLEFTAYAIATAMAVAENDPTYFAQSTQFKEFLAWNCYRAMTIYRAGAVLEDFAWSTQDSYYQTLRTSPDAAPVRDFVSATYSPAFTAVLFDL